MSILESLTRFLCQIERSGTGAHYHQHAVGEFRNDARVRNRNGWRRINQDPIENWRQSLQQPFKSSIGEELRWVSDRLPAGNQKQVFVAPALDHRKFVHLSQQIIRKTRTGVSSERDMKARKAKIGVND
jgi:hypothetical protein